MRFRIVALVSLGFIFSASVLAQGKEELALKGITLIDLGQYKEGIKELRKARNLDPSDYELTLELGRAFLLYGKPLKAQDYLNLLLNHDDRTPELFVLLSRSSAGNGKESPLNQGLVEFPDAGVLFAEMGRVLATSDKFDRAIAYWEKGIEVDPSYADNYLYASKLYLVNDELTWAWLYGETYLNLKHEDHPDPQFVKDIRNAFRRSVTLAAVDKPRDELGAIVYSLAEGCEDDSKPRSTSELSERLPCLLERWQVESRSPFNVPVFKLYERIIKLNKLEHYLHWVYGSSTDPEFNSWKETNASSYEEFSNWMYWNGLELSTENRFVKLNKKGR